MNDFCNIRTSFSYQGNVVISNKSDHFCVTPLRAIIIISNREAIQPLGVNLVAVNLRGTKLTYSAYSHCRVILNIFNIISTKITGICELRKAKLQYIVRWKNRAYSSCRLLK